MSQWLTLLSLLLQTPGSEVKHSHPTVTGRGLKNNCPGQRAVCGRALLILILLLIIHSHSYKDYSYREGKDIIFQQHISDRGRSLHFTDPGSGTPTNSWIYLCKKPTSTDTLSCLCSALCIISNLLYLCSAPDPSTRLIMNSDRCPAVATSLQHMPWPLRPLIPSTANSRMDHHHTRFFSI